jgi:hypothetical protein
MKKIGNLGILETTLNWHESKSHNINKNMRFVNHANYPPDLSIAKKNINSLAL